MSDYSTIDKTGWFIQKMMSGWFSRTEIVDLATREFPTISRKTLDGTIGQYWSDSVNPKWGTKAIHARGLKVAESTGRRRIVGSGEIPRPPTRTLTIRVQELTQFQQQRLATCRVEVMRLAICGAPMIGNSGRERWIGTGLL